MIEFYGSPKSMEIQNDELVNQIIKVEPSGNIDRRMSIADVSLRYWPSISNETIYSGGATDVIEIVDSDEEPVVCLNCDFYKFSEKFHF